MDRYKTLDTADKDLINFATRIIKKNYKEPCHTVGSAILCGSGKTYSAINVDSTSQKLCAEQIVLGTAISEGEQVFKKIVAVNKLGKLISPCGNCRQLLFFYASTIQVILTYNDINITKTIKNLLPDPYEK